MTPTQRITTFLLFAAMLAIPATVQAQEVPLGTELPLANRSMSVSDGSSTTLAGLGGTASTVIIFWSNQCRWVDRYEDRLGQLVSDFEGRGVSFVLVNANDPSANPEESQSASGERASSRGYRAPYVIDAGSELATALGATRTPHVYVFNGENRLVYVGSVDDSPGDPANVERSYLADALEALVSGATIDVPQTKAFGCTIRFPR